MLEYDRIDISEGIDIKKCKDTSAECGLCKFSYFLDKNFNYGPYLCNGCNDYRVNFAFISKKDAYNLIKNAVTMGEKGTL